MNVIRIVTRRGMRVAIVVTLATFALVASATPAAAHAVLETTEPAPGVSLDAAPDEIVLRYTEAVDLSAATVRVFDSTGDEVGTDDVSHLAGDLATARIDAPALDDGAYVVTWRVTSADGHPISGAFTFAVGDAEAATEVDGLAARLLADEGGSTLLGAVYAATRFLAFTAVLLAIGGCAFFVVVAPSTRASVATRRWLTAALAVGIATALVAIGLQGANAAGGGVGDAVSGEVVSDSLGTRFGRAGLVRAVALLALLPLLGAIRRRSVPVGRVPIALGAIGGLVALGTFAVAGHASTGRWVAAAVVADVVHLGAAALWFGGVVVLALAVVPRDVVVRATDARVALGRFSRLATVAVAVVAASGVFQAWRQLDGVDALRSTDYGRLLLLKLLFVGAIVTVASSARDVVRKRVLAPIPATGSLGPGAMAVTETDDRRAGRHLRQAVVLEIAFAVLALATTAVLVNADPARAEESEPFAATLEAPDVWFDVEVIDATAGLNDVHVTAREPTVSFAGRDVLEMTATLTEAERDIAPIDVPLRRLQPGHYQARGVTIPFAGDWTLEVSALLTDVDEATASATVPIR